MMKHNTVWLLIYLVFADWLIGPGQKVGGYQITLPNPAGGILGTACHAGYYSCSFDWDYDMWHIS
jgi:hypothetical protein